MKKKIIALLMALSVAFTPAMTVCAETHTVTVDADMNDNYTVVVPATLALQKNGNTDNTFENTLQVTVSGAITPGKGIVLNAGNSFTLTDTVSPTNTVTGTVTKLTDANTIDGTAGAKIITAATLNAVNTNISVNFVKVSADLIKSGTYTGTLTVQYSLETI